MFKRLIVIAASLSLVLGVAAGSLFLSGALTSRAVQNPTLSLDMMTAGNTYSGPESPGAAADPWFPAADNQCGLDATSTPDALDQDGDGLVNDGCPTVGGSGGLTTFADPETGAQCLNNIDDDLADDGTDPSNPTPGANGLINDGCPEKGRMVLGTIQNCLNGNTNTLHPHTVHVVLQLSQHTI